MKISNIKNVCVIDSMYTLLQYLLMQTIDDIEHTFFFWSDGISEEVRLKFKGSSAYIDIHRTKKNAQKSQNILNRILFYLRPLAYFIKYPIKWPFILDDKIRYYGVDHLKYSQNILRKHKFELLEDGTLNYFKNNSFPSYSPKQKKILNFLYGNQFSQKTEYAGDESTCSKIHLTGLLPLPNDYPQKVEIESLLDLWNRCNSEKKTYINEIYKLDLASLQKLKVCNKILMTRPFSEDNVMSENEKIELYKRFIRKIGCDGLLIKKHPRERTDYSQFFPNVVVMNQSVPMQLLTFNGIKFEEAYAICTTSILDFPYHIRIGYIGSEIDYRIEKKLPNMKTCNVSFEGKDIELINIKI